MKQMNRLRILIVLCLVILGLKSNSHAEYNSQTEYFISPYVEPPSEYLTPQNFNLKMCPVIQGFSRNSNILMILSDGSVWQVDKLSNSAVNTWEIGDQVLLRWSITNRMYFFYNVTRYASLEVLKNPIEYENSTVFVSLIQPPIIWITDIGLDGILSLSNGLVFKFIPFTGNQLKLGDRVLISWNENIQGEFYPYFMVGYRTSNSIPLGWESIGEIQARVIPQS
jgi:hypothetical protein